MYESLYQLLQTITDSECIEPKNINYKKGDSQKLNDEENRIYEIFKDLSELVLKINDRKTIFFPKYVCRDGRRSFALEDLNESDYKLLEKIELEELPLALRARVADVFWLEKRDFKRGKIAESSYWKLFKKACDSEEKCFTGLDFLKRALNISKCLNKGNLDDSYVIWLDQFLERDSLNCFSHPYKEVFPLRVIEEFFRQKTGRGDKYLKAINWIIKESLEAIYVEDFPLIVFEQAFELKEKILSKLNKNEAIRDMKKELLNYYLCFISVYSSKQSYVYVDLMDLYIKAIDLASFLKKEDLTRKLKWDLQILQKENFKSIPRFTLTTNIANLVLFDSIKISNFDFQESLIYLTTMVHFFSKENIKAIVSKGYNFLLYRCLTPVCISQFGKIIKNLPEQFKQKKSKRKSSSGCDEEPGDNLIYHKLSEIQNFIGGARLRNALIIIRKNHVFKYEDFSFLFSNNEIVPPRRKEIIQEFIFLFLKGEYYKAIQLLALQMEPMFSYILNEKRSIPTYKFNKDGTNEEIPFKEVFKLLEETGALDSKIIFNFKGLLIEKYGSNIRNRVAHGQLEEYESYGGDCLYLGVLIIKLLAMHSDSYPYLLNKILLRNSLAQMWFLSAFRPLEKWLKDNQ